MHTSEAIELMVSAELQLSLLNRYKHEHNMVESLQL